MLRAGNSIARFSGEGGAGTGPPGAAAAAGWRQSAGSAAPLVPQPLTAPAVSPRTKYRCRARNTMIGQDHGDEPARGRELPALTQLALELGERDGDRLVVAWSDEDQGDQQVVPDPQELEDRERRQRRHRHREHQPVEGLVMAGPVDLGGLDHRLGQASTCSCAGCRSPVTCRSRYGPATPRGRFRSVPKFL